MNNEWYVVRAIHLMADLYPFKSTYLLSLPVSLINSHKVKASLKVSPPLTLVPKFNLYLIIINKISLL